MTDVRLRVASLAGACLALAALSLLFPSSPTYDPWAWIVWGREIAHLDLSTVDGPSWKPLPVLFTTPFSLFGDAAPALWLVVARAGALAALVAAYALARRLGGAVAGAAAVGGLVLAPWFVRNATLGNSEGLMLACVLAAVERHLAGRPRQTFAFAVAAALMRPEAWPFLGLYALWLVQRERRAVLPAVAAGLGCLPVLWLLPELWGSGNLMRAADRAQQPLSNSAAFADHPAIRVVADAAQMLTTPVWIGLACALLLAAGRRAVAGIAILALAWIAEVALMTSGGFSGNQRYLIVPVALLIVVAAAGVGLAAERLPRLRRASLATALVARPVMPPLALLAGLAFVAPGVGAVGKLEHSLRYQGELMHRLADVVGAAGGAARLNACGAAYTGPFLVPAVAWQLGVHTAQVGLEPRAPAVVFRVKTNARAHAVPTLRDVPAGRNLARDDSWRIVAVCR